jgi:hypothetical protein
MRATKVNQLYRNAPVMADAVDDRPGLDYFEGHILVRFGGGTTYATVREPTTPATAGVPTGAAISFTRMGTYRGLKFDGTSDLHHPNRIAQWRELGDLLGFSHCSGRRPLVGSCRNRKFMVRNGKFPLANFSF